MPETRKPHMPVTRALGALDRLETILKVETEALRAGNLTAGLSHTDEKAEAAAEYRAVLAEIARPGTHLAHMPAPDLVELRRRHALFERSVSLNLAVIATMRSVAEGILREVSDRMAPVAPAAYGPPGHTRNTTSAPISLSLTT